MTTNAETESCWRAFVRHSPSVLAVRNVLAIRNRSPRSTARSLSYWLNKWYAAIG